MSFWRRFTRWLINTWPPFFPFQLTPLKAGLTDEQA